MDDSTLATPVLLLVDWPLIRERIKNKNIFNKKSVLFTDLAPKFQKEKSKQFINIFNKKSVLFTDMDRSTPGLLLVDWPHIKESKIKNKSKQSRFINHRQFRIF